MPTQRHQGARVPLVLNHLLAELIFIRQRNAPHQIHLIHFLRPRLGLPPGFAGLCARLFAAGGFLGQRRAGQDPDISAANPFAGIPDIAIADGERPPFAVQDLLAFGPRGLQFFVFRQRMGAGQFSQIEHRAHVVGINLPSRAKCLKGGKFLFLPHQNNPEIVGHLGNHQTQQIFIQMNRVVPGHGMLHVVLHALPKGLLGLHQRNHIHLPGLGLHAIEESIRNQIAVLPEHVRNINDAGRRRPPFGHHEVIHEGAEIALLQRNPQRFVSEIFPHVFQVQRRRDARQSNHDSGSAALPERDAQHVIHQAR